MDGMSWRQALIGVALVTLVACGQPQPGATTVEPSTAQPPVTLSGSQQPDTHSEGAPGAVSHGGPVTGHVSFVDHLRGKGLTVEPVGEAHQPFFQPTGTKLRISGGDLKQPVELESYEYESAEMAEADVSTIGPDGNPKTMMVEWVAPPHFFHKERLVVLYVGNDPAVLTILTEGLGPQFAGK